MYKVLGTDGNEYGPVSAEQVKQWIAENRVEKKTPVIPEGEMDWVFLGSLPEFAAAFAPPPSAAPQPSVAPHPPAFVGASKSADRPTKDRQGDPRENSRAWTAYCLGVVSVVPPMGAFLGIPALVMGIAGLRFQRRNPEAGGRFQAWMGIVLGVLFGLGYLLLGVLVIVDWIAHGHLTR
ncbi:MAG: GYF domain-containing protein [Verrucomicrobiota bacterium]|jgi:hypothetical protein